MIIITASGIREIVISVCWSLISDWTKFFRIRLVLYSVLFVRTHSYRTPSRGYLLLPVSWTKHDQAFRREFFSGKIILFSTPPVIASNWVT